METLLMVAGIRQHGREKWGDERADFGDGRSWIGATAVMAALGAFFWLPGEATAATEPYDEVRVVSRCDLTAQKLVNNPSSFSTAWTWDKNDDGRKVTIRRNFTAMNSFGAHLDHHYECVYDYVDGRLVDLTLQTGSSAPFRKQAVENRVSLDAEKSSTGSASDSGPDLSQITPIEKLSQKYAVSVPPDPNTRYTVLDAERIDEHHVTVTSQRNGSSGVSFAKRLVNCRKGTFKYLGEGDTLEQLVKATPEARMGSLTGGSISTYISISACKQFGI